MICLGKAEGKPPFCLPFEVHLGAAIVPAAHAGGGRGVGKFLQALILFPVLCCLAAAPPLGERKVPLCWAGGLSPAGGGHCRGQGNREPAPESIRALAHGKGESIFHGCSHPERLNRMKLDTLGFGGSRTSPHGALLLHPSEADRAGRRTVAGRAGARQAHGLGCVCGRTPALSGGP